MNFLKQNSKLFIGVSVMIFLCTLGLSFQRDAVASLFEMKIPIEMIPVLKFSIFPCTLFLAIPLIFLCKGGNTGFLFKMFFILNGSVLTILSFIPYDTLLAHPYMIYGFYIWLGATQILPYALIWGFANQEYSFKTAALQYPIIGFIFANLGLLATGPLLAWANLAFAPTTLFFLIPALMSGLILAAYLFMSRKDLGPNEPGAPVAWYYWASFGAILLGIAFLSDIPKKIIKKQLIRIFSDPQSYRDYLTTTNAHGLIGIIGGILVIAAGLILYFKGPKYFFKIAALSSVSIFLFGCIAWNLPLDKENLWLGSLSMSAVAILAPILVSLKELAYFGFERKKRLRAKIIIDVLIRFLTDGAPGLFMTGLFIWNNSTNMQTPAFLIALVIAMILCLAGFYYVYHVLQRQKLAQNMGNKRS